MIDKVQKIRKEVERLKSQLLRGACSSQVVMETLCKEEAYNEVLTILDTLQEEPVSIWHDASEEPNGDNSIVIAYDNGCTVEPSFKDFKSYSEWGIIKKSYRVKQWAYVNDVLNLTNKEEPVSEDEIEKQFKVGDIVVYMSRHPAYSGLYLLGNPNDLSIGYSNADEPYQIALRNCTVASEDERRQFMRELNDNGYKWNEVTLRIDKKEKSVSDPS